MKTLYLFPLNVKIYVQVFDSIMNETTWEREFKALEKVKDNYPKYVLTMDLLNYSKNGIKHFNILDFLKSENI